MARTNQRQLLADMNECNVNHLSTGRSTYWSTDRRKVPDLINFSVIKGINTKYRQNKSVTLVVKCNITLRNKTTNGEQFRAKLDVSFGLEVL